MEGKQSTQAKRQEIVKWAFERFYDGGFHATGIDTVMADSGISKRTLYKYFPSKEDLIEAVLDHYTDEIEHELFDPVMTASEDPRQQIMAFFDIREALMHESFTRGCMGIKAAQEYAGKHAGIAARAKSFVENNEQRFIEICKRGGFAEPEQLGKQINLLFQGSLLMSQVYGDNAAFASAKAAAALLLDKAGEPSAHLAG
jgi:AcrR family transcriptional regulator